MPFLAVLAHGNPLRLLPGLVLGKVGSKVPGDGLVGYAPQLGMRLPYEILILTTCRIAGQEGTDDGLEATADIFGCRPMAMALAPDGSEILALGEYWPQFFLLDEVTTDAQRG